MPFLDLGEVRIHYLFETPTIEENGLTLVLIHGTPVDLRFWNPLIPLLLNKGFSVLRYDIRGHGKSSAPTSGYSIIRRITDLKSLLDHLNLTKDLILVGHSLGGGEVFNFSVSHLNYVKGICIFDSWVSGFQLGSDSPLTRNYSKIFKEKPIKEAMKELKNSVDFYKLMTNSKEANQLFDEMLFSSPVGMLLDDGSIRDPPFKTIEKLTILKKTPILFLVGEFSNQDFHKIGEHVKKVLPHTIFQVVEGVNHLGPLEFPQNFEKLIINWIQHLPN